MSASGRNDRPCKVCKKNFEHCPHSLWDEDQKDRDDHIRAIVRDEVKQIAKREAEDELRLRRKIENEIGPEF